MRYPNSLFRMSPRWRWLTKPILAFGAGGSAVALWLEEEPLLIAGEVCPALVVLAGMGALLCRFYHQIFEAAKPRPQDSSATFKHDSLIE
jgi:hypothetical protein